MTKKDFVLSVCSHRGINPITATCIEWSHQVLGNSFLVKYDSGDAWLDRLRSKVATEFLDHEWADYMIFVDDDIVFRPEHLTKLHQDMVAGYDLIGGLYPTRTGEQLSSMGHGAGGPITIDGEIKEIKWLATGFMGFSKSLLRDIVVKLNLPRLHKGQWCECYPFFVFQQTGMMLMSEDWHFCEVARQIGIKTYADTSITLGHIGDKVWSINDAIAATKERAAKGNKDMEILPDSPGESAQKNKTEVVGDEALEVSCPGLSGEK